MRTPIDFGKEFLQAYFNKRDAKEALKYLAEDIVWLTPDEILHMKSRKAIGEFLSGEIAKDPRQFNVDIASIKSAPASDDTSTIVYEINLLPKHTEESIDLRCSLTIHRDGISYELVFVGMSRKFTRTSSEHIRSFIDNLPSGVMVLASLAPNNVRELFCNSYIEKIVDLETAQFYDRFDKNPFFMLPYEEQKHMHTMVAELAALKKPRPVSMQVNVIRNDGTSIPFQAILTAAYKEGSRTIIYILFNELTDILREVERAHKKDIAAVTTLEQEKAAQEQEEMQKEALEAVSRAHEAASEAVSRARQMASQEVNLAREKASQEVSRAHEEAGDLIDEALDKADELMQRLHEEAENSIRRAKAEAADEAARLREESEQALEQVRRDAAEALLKAQEAVQKAEEAAAKSDALAEEAIADAEKARAKAQEEIRQLEASLEEERTAAKAGEEERIHEAEEAVRRELAKTIESEQQRLQELEKSLQEQTDALTKAQEKYESLEDSYRRNDMQYQDRILKLEWQLKDAGSAQEEKFAAEKAQLEQDFAAQKDALVSEWEEKIRILSENSEAALRDRDAQLENAKSMAAGEREGLLARIEGMQEQLRQKTLGQRKLDVEQELRSKEREKAVRRMGFLLGGQMRSVESMARTAGKEQDILRRQDTLEHIADIAAALPDMAKDIEAIAGIDLSQRVSKDEQFLLSSCIETVRRIVWPQCRENGIIFACETSGQVPDEVRGSKTGLQLALLSVLENAVKATANGGRITLTVSADPPVKDRAYYHFDIADTGTGIPDDQLPALFDDPTGELALARRITGMMGGSIQVRSALGQGARFEISANLGV